MVSGPRPERAASGGTEGEAVVARASDRAWDFQEGELVLLWLRPSVWRLIVPLAGVSLVVALAAAGMHVASSTGSPGWKLAVLGAMWGAAVGWSMGDWWSHAYVLTDRRVMARSGVLSPMIAEAPLSAVWRVTFTRSRLERAFGLGSVNCIEIHRADHVCWPMVARPQSVHQAVLDAVRRYGRSDASGGEEG